MKNHKRNYIIYTIVNETRKPRLFESIQKRYNISTAIHQAMKELRKKMNKEHLKEIKIYVKQI